MTSPVCATVNSELRNCPAANMLPVPAPAIPRVRPDFRFATGRQIGDDRDDQRTRLDLPRRSSHRSRFQSFGRHASLTRAVARRPCIALYLKDESTHPTGSLKHRLARSLFLYGLCNGWIGPRTTVVEASSGSTAVSEAYFARMLGLPFIAVMPRSTSAEKVAQIASYGGESHFVESAAAMYAESARLARALGGHYMDQFTYAERATDWRGNNNIAEIDLCADGE